jgi:hypothetical protein
VSATTTDIPAQANYVAQVDKRRAKRAVPGKMA